MAAALLLFYLVAGLPGRGTTLVFSQWWENELDDGVLKKLTADFEEQHPGIKIQVEKKSRQEIKAMLFGVDDEPKGKKKRKTADIFSIEGSWADETGHSLASPGIQKTPRQKNPLNASQDFLPPGPPGKTDNGFVPVISFINSLFYNIDLLREAGFDRPPKNQVEFLSYVQAITKPGEGIYGAVFALGDENSHAISRHILSWIWSAGILRGEDTFDFTSERVIESFRFLNQLKPYLFPDPFETDEQTKFEIFRQGKAGMMIGTVLDVKTLRAEMTHEFSITTIPGPASYVGKPVFPLSSWYVGINAESENREEAETFIAFLLEHASELASGAFAIPGGGDRDPDLVQNDPYYSKAYDMYDAGEMIREVYGTGRIRKLNSVIYEETKRMFEGRSPEDTAAAIQERWETIGTESF
jgi:multiple sugar transport system substrate-binding protein